jgi:hypothetical protein
VGEFGGENGYMRRILEGNKINGGELPFLWPTPRARSMFHAFLFCLESPSAPRKAEDGLGEGFRSIVNQKFSYECEQENQDLI